ncbi:glutathione peroxidase [Planctobacterium marinum]|uniref:glutathione peroxidase n=1 Tax=Planctobacterium marinum TaxID=1631968 RepID=UPI001E3EFFA7|nr:glutathione peroxidase [Planctobacterium marinum]MCC2604456.1 glutathione peroxidase [Planctobacterium marinum]
MKRILLLAILSLCSIPASWASECPSELKHLKRKLNSQETVNLCNEYGGKAVLIVNTASYCGFTPQFEGLEALYSQYKDKGFVVLGFPSHDFNQEDKDEAKTAELCELTYGVKFPMFEPLHVKGDDADPLYRQLSKATGTEPKWNFYKYLITSTGEKITSYSSYTKPTDSDFIADIESALPR